MFRKFTLGLTAFAAIASVALIAGTANAKAPHGNSNYKMVKQVHPHFHPHGHIYIKRVYARTFVRPVRYGAVQVVSNGPCTCLTKDYTPEGQVVFKDLCTKEMAMAPVEGVPAQASEIQSPTNMAGKTYQDYLAANPQAQNQAQAAVK